MVQTQCIVHDNVAHGEYWRFLQLVAARVIPRNCSSTDNVLRCPAQALALRCYVAPAQSQVLAGARMA